MFFSHRLASTTSMLSSICQNSLSLSVLNGISKTFHNFDGNLRVNHWQQTIIVWEIAAFLSWFTMYSWSLPLTLDFFVLLFTIFSDLSVQNPMHFWAIINKCVCSTLPKQKCSQLSKPAPIVLSFSPPVDSSGRRAALSDGSHWRCALCRNHWQRALNVELLNGIQNETSVSISYTQ